MPSTYTGLNRLELQNPGENLNTWGSKLNNDTTAIIDFAISGVTSMALSGPVTLTTANGAADQARSAILIFTSGTGGTITIPAVSHVYQVRNACSGNLVFTTGSGTTATVEPGSSATVICDGTNCYRFTDAADVAACLATAEAYTDAAAFSSASGNLPGQGGNAGKYLQTNGTVPSWVAIASSDVTGALGFTPQVALGYTPLNAAANLSDVGNVGTARTNLGVPAVGADTTYAFRANNLGDLASASVARANLGVTATGADPAYLAVANNLSDVASASASRTNLGVSPIVTYAHFANEQVSGQGSNETLTNGAWSKRLLNTVVFNNISGCSISGSQITLPAGTYEVTASAQALDGNNATVFTQQLRIRNVTDSSTPVVGTNCTATSPSGNTNEVTAVLQGRFVLAGSKLIELDSFTRGNANGTGGTAASSGEVEVYVSIYLRKVA